MKSQKIDQERIRTLVMGGILSALVVVLQYLGSFIKFGPFSVSLVLVPIIVGAAVCNEKISTWLGFLFGVIVLISGDAAPFLAISVAGTVTTVLLKGAVAGLCSGIVYRLFSKKNRYLAIIVSAIVCPVVNTGLFLLGARVFFYDTIASWGAEAGYLNTASYMILGLVGANFLFELGMNIVLAPIILRIIRIKIK